MMDKKAGDTILFHKPDDQPPWRYHSMDKGNGTASMPSRVVGDFYIIGFPVSLSINDIFNSASNASAIFSSSDILNVFRLCLLFMFCGVCPVLRASSASDIFPLFTQHSLIYSLTSMPYLLFYMIHYILYLVNDLIYFIKNS